MSHHTPILDPVRPDGAQAILEAAEALFAQRGFAAVSISDIATVAGVSKANIFHHFKSKQGLYLAVLRQAVTRAAGILSQEVPAGPERLRDFFRDHLQALLAQPEATRLILHEVLEQGSERGECRRCGDPRKSSMGESSEGVSGCGESLAEEIFAGYFSRLVGWVREDQAAGRLREGVDPALIAFLLIAVNVHFFQALPILRHLPEAEFASDPARFSEAAFDLLMQGIVGPAGREGG